MRWPAIRLRAMVFGAVFCAGGLLGFVLARAFPPGSVELPVLTATHKPVDHVIESPKTGDVWRAAVTMESSGPLPDATASLLYFPFARTTPTQRGVEAASTVLRALDGDSASCTSALKMYAEIERVENLGGEYPSLRWTCDYLLADEDVRATMRADGDGARFLAMMEPNHWAELKKYIVLKYGLANAEPPRGADFLWLDEFVRFNSPGRAAWEHAEDVVNLVHPTPGLIIADIGAGSGFYAYRFADLVGPRGKVYAVELDPGHLAYLQRTKLAENRTNLDVVEGTPDSVGLPPNSVDVIFLCSTYQTIYGSIRAADRERWIASMKAALRPNGRVVISENTPDGELGGLPPYRGISISRNIIVTQLEAFGFRLVESKQFIPQRYLVAFHKADQASQAEARVVGAARSLFSVPLPAPRTTEGGAAAGKLMKSCLDDGGEACKQAVAAYAALEAKENFAGEYSSLRWIAAYRAEDPAGQAKMRQASPDGDRLVRAIGANNFAEISTYVDNKYSSFTTPVKRGQMEFHVVDELLRFNSPDRPRWEHTDEILDWLGVQAGTAVADIGSGPGFLTWHIADRIGANGTVYTTEVTPEHLTYLRQVVAEDKRTNVQVIEGRSDASGLAPASVDLIVLCHTYQAIYGISSSGERTEFVASLRTALRPGGRLVVMESLPEDELPTGEVPYMGFAIAPELVRAQLQGLGFHLVEERRFVPQRYALLFTAG